MEFWKAAARPAPSEQRREAGQGLVEYALILVLVSVVVIVILSQLGVNVGGVFCKVTTALGGGSSQTLTGTLTGMGHYHFQNVSMTEGETIQVSLSTDALDYAAQMDAMVDVTHGGSFTAPHTGTFTFGIEGSAGATYAATISRGPTCGTQAQGDTIISSGL
jgi:pilus assembly protein Flp/PilA